MGTREAMSEVRREAVLSATSDLLDEVGVAALTIRQVAERAGVAVGTVFLFAENKADLVHKVYGKRVAAGWHTLLDSLSGLPPLTRVEQFFVGCVDIFFDDRENVLAYYQAMASDALVNLDDVELLISRIRCLLEEAALAGELRSDVDVEILTYSYQGLYSNVIMLAGRGEERARVRSVVATSLRQLRYGISAEQ